jgi:hypothetical protein
MNKRPKRVEEKVQECLCEACGTDLNRLEQLEIAAAICEKLGIELPGLQQKRKRRTK